MTNQQQEMIEYTTQEVIGYLIEDNGVTMEQKEVKGLIRFGVMQQYVSAGLGASANIPFLGFRLFDTPEINLITLRVPV